MTTCSECSLSDKYVGKAFCPILSGFLEFDSNCFCENLLIKATKEIVARKNLGRLHMLENHDKVTKVNVLLLEEKDLESL